MTNTKDEADQKPGRRSKVVSLEAWKSRRTRSYRQEKPGELATAEL